MEDKDYGIFQSLKKLKKISLEVGVFADSKNTNSKPLTYVADYAIANEFGTEKIPKRSFMRSTADEQKTEWQDQLENVADNVINGNKQGVERKMYKVGQLARRDIIDKIDSNITPVNAPSTKKKKLKQGKNKTLIDTGILRGSIEAKVKGV